MRTSKASLFLIELIVLILFFALAGAICVKLFVASHIDSVAGENLSQAVLAAQSVAEAYKVADSDDEAIQYLRGAQKTDTGFEILYNEKWEPVGASQAVFRIAVDISQNDGVGEARINALEYCPPEQRAQVADKPSIYTLNVKKLLY